MLSNNGTWLTSTTMLMAALQLEILRLMFPHLSTRWISICNFKYMTVIRRLARIKGRSLVARFGNYWSNNFHKPIGWPHIAFSLRKLLRPITLNATISIFIHDEKRCVVSLLGLCLLSIWTTDRDELCTNKWCCTNSCSLFFLTPHEQSIIVC